MARLPYADESEPEVAALAARVRSERGGRMPHLYRMLLNTPPVATGWLAFMTAVRQQCTLPAKLRELAILRVAQLNLAQAEYDAHVKFGMQAGVTQAQIDALEEWAGASVFDEAERAALGLAEAMTLHVQVPDAVFADVARVFGTREATELTVTIAAYNMTTRFMEALALEPDFVRAGGVVQ
jgi:AhpD family alkylhydroperoxidase